MVSKQRAIEVSSVVITSIVLAYIGIISGYNLIAIDTPPQQGITVKVIARQFYWSFEYPNGTSITFPNGTTKEYPNGITLENVLYVRVGQVVELEIVSMDVVHGFFIPELGIHINAIPGHVNNYWLKADQPGQYRIMCANFCGTSHYSMIGQVVAVP